MTIQRNWRKQHSKPELRGPAYVRKLQSDIQARAELRSRRASGHRDRPVGNDHVIDVAPLPRNTVDLPPKSSYGGLTILIIAVSSLALIAAVLVVLGRSGMFGSKIAAKLAASTKIGENTANNVIVGRVPEKSHLVEDIVAAAALMPVMGLSGYGAYHQFYPNHTLWGIGTGIGLLAVIGLLCCGWKKSKKCNKMRVCAINTAFIVAVIFLWKPFVGGFGWDTFCNKGLTLLPGAPAQCPAEFGLTTEIFNPTFTNYVWHYSVYCGKFIFDLLMITKLPPIIYKWVVRPPLRWFGLIKEKPSPTEPEEEPVEKKGLLGHLKSLCIGTTGVDEENADELYDAMKERNVSKIANEVLDCVEDVLEGSSGLDAEHLSRSIEGVCCGKGKAAKAGFYSFIADYFNSWLDTDA